MCVALAADHAGYPLKETIRHLLDEAGIRYEDLGAYSADPVDYPDLAAAAAEAVVSGRCRKALLFCGTGIGMAIAANKVSGIRAAVAWSVETAELSRAHNDANILALGARTTPPELAGAMVRAFLATPFAAGRHSGRLAKIARLERVAPPPPVNEGDHP